MSADPATTDLGRLWFRMDSLEAGMRALRTEVKGELALAAAALKESDAKRSTELHRVSSEIGDVKRDFDNLKTTLPTKDSIRKSTRNWALGLGGFFIALATLLWMFFDTGAGITGSVADQLVDQERAEANHQAEIREIKQLIINSAKDSPYDNTQAGAPAGQAGGVPSGERSGGRP